MASVNAIAAKFNQNNLVLGMAKGAPNKVPEVQEPASTTPQVAPKPPTKPSNYGGVSSGSDEMVGIAGARSNLKPLKPTKPQDPVSKKPAFSHKSKTIEIVPSDKKTPPTFGSKPVPPVKQPNGHIGPGVLPKKPLLTPPKNIQHNNKENSEPDKVKPGSDSQTSFSSIRDRIANMGGPPVNVLPKKPLLRQKESETNKNKNETSDKFEEKIYCSSEYKNYVLEKLPELSGPPPAKPKLPAHVDLYDFQVDDAEEEDLYESYDDVVAPLGKDFRPVSTIPEFTEADELKLASRGNDNIEQENYDDTVVSPDDRKDKSQSYIDEEYYEDFDELEVTK